MVVQRWGDPDFDAVFDGLEILQDRHQRLAAHQVPGRFPGPSRLQARVDEVMADAASRQRRGLRRHEWDLTSIELYRLEHNDDDGWVFESCWYSPLRRRAVPPPPRRPLLSTDRSVPDVAHRARWWWDDLATTVAGLEGVLYRHGEPRLITGAVMAAVPGDKSPS